MDNDKAKVVSVMKDFMGLVSDIDPCDAPSGAFVVQINCFSLSVGSVETRLGLAQVSFTYV